MYEVFEHQGLGVFYRGVTFDIDVFARGGRDRSQENSERTCAKLRTSAPGEL